MKQSLLYILFTITLLFKVPAQETLTLDKVVEYVLKNNFDIRIQDFGKQIAANENTKANAGGLPRVRLVSDLRYGLQGVQDPTSIAAGFIQTIGVTPKLQTEWLLFGAKRVRNVKSALETKESGSNFEYQLTVEAKLVGAIITFYKGLLLVENKAKTDTLLEQSKKKWGVSKRKYDEGSMDGYEYHQKEKSLWNDSINSISASLELNNVYAQLKTLCSLPDSTVINLEGEMPQNFETFDLAILKQRVKESNNRLKLESSYLYLKELDIGIKKSYNKPLIALTNQVYTDFQRIRSRFTDKTFSANLRFFIGFSMSWNLWDGGKVKGQIRSAELDYEKQALNLEKVENNIFNELKESYDEYIQKKQILQVRKNDLKASEYLFKFSAKRYESGLISSFQHFQTKQSYLRALSDMYNAQFHVIVKELDLVRMSGGILDFTN